MGACSGAFLGSSALDQAAGHPGTPGLAPYPLSKVIAERAAWDLIERDGGGTELVAVNPTFVLGPTPATGLSSARVVKAMLDGTMSIASRQRFGVVDVRDLAGLHIRAMAAPGAAGKRFLAVADGPTMSYLKVAETPAPATRPVCRPRAHAGGVGGRPAAAGHPQRPGSR